MKKLLLLITILAAATPALFAQRKLNFSNVTNEQVRSEGDIRQDQDIKGYYLLIQDDLISKDSSHYALRILDENLNPVKEIPLRESNKFFITEAATNDNSVAFLCGDARTHNARLLVYDSAGTLLYAYTRPHVKGQGRLPYYVYSTHNPRANKNLYNAGTHGYVVTYPIRKNIRNSTFEFHYYDSKANKQWKYQQPMEHRHNIEAEYLASTDSMMMLHVLNSHLTRKMTTRMTAFNFYTKKKVFDIDGSKQQFAMLPTSVITEKNNDTIYVLGNYFKGNQKEWNRHSEGIGLLKLDMRGRVLSEAYDSWAKDLGPSLNVNRKGKSKELGYLYLHDFLQGPNGNFYAVAEGYKRQICPMGLVFSTILLPFTQKVMMTQTIATDLMVMEFDSKFKLRRNSIYDKKDRILAVGTDGENLHRMGNLYKRANSYDYRFTTITEDRKNFAICFNDTRKSDKHDWGSFHILRYNGVKFRDDEVRYKTTDGNISISPAKAGSLLFLERDYKKKKVSMRLEKVS